MPDLIDLAGAQDEARRRVVTLAADQWALPTPCDDWNVRGLVVHLIEGSRMAARLLRGASAEAASTEFGAARGPDLAAELDAAMADELSAFGQPGVLDLIVHHPGAGDIPGARLLQFRTGDHLLHSWDLARATGADERLPEGLVAATWEAMGPLAPVIGGVGAFGTGPSGTIGPEAPLQQRLLDLVGRRA